MDYWSRGFRPMLERTRSFMIHFFPLFCVTSHKSTIDICLRHVCRLFLSTVVHLHILRKCFPVSRWNRFQSWTESRNFFITHRFPSFLPWTSDRRSLPSVRSFSFSPFSELALGTKASDRHELVRTYVSVMKRIRTHARFPGFDLPFFPGRTFVPEFRTGSPFKKVFAFGIILILSS